MAVGVRAGLLPGARSLVPGRAQGLNHSPSGPSRTHLEWGSLFPWRCLLRMQMVSHSHGRNERKPHGSRRATVWEAQTSAALLCSLAQELG